MNIAVLVSGGGTNLEAIIENLKQEQVSNVKVSVVISNKSDAYALERAKNHGIPSVCISPRAYETKDKFSEVLLHTLREYQVDLVVLAGYLVIVPKQVIRAYENRIINIHPSLIPSFCGDGYYGLKVHEAVLARGCRVTGATVHFVDEGTDTGPILLQQAVEVEQGDTKEILQRRVMEQAEWKILPRAIRLIADGKVKVVDQKVVML